VTRSSIITNSSFLVTVVTEAALMHRRLSWWIAAGSAVLLVGIALATHKAEAGGGKE
jgi:drug/metabolite transporter (DMT)-like permease